MRNTYVIKLTFSKMDLTTKHPCDLLTEYNRSFYRLVLLFVSIYYPGEKDWYVIGSDNMMAPSIVCIGDDYWSIEEIWEAIEHNARANRLFKYYETRDSHKMRLCHYLKGKTKYTKKRKEEDELNIEELRRSLYDTIELFNN